MDAPVCFQRDEARPTISHRSADIPAATLWSVAMAEEQVPLELTRDEIGVLIDIMEEELIMIADGLSLDLNIISDDGEIDYDLQILVAHVNDNEDHIDDETYARVEELVELLDKLGCK